MAITTKSEYTIVIDEGTKFFKKSKMKQYVYTLACVTFREGTDDPFFVTNDMIDALDRTVSKLRYISPSDTEHDAAKEYISKQLLYLENDIKLMREALNNKVVRKSDIEN